LRQNESTSVYMRVKSLLWQWRQSTG